MHPQTVDETFFPLEQDPTGRNPHQPGAKLDAGKNRLGLVLGGFARALQAVGEVGTFGAAKYTDHGWTTVPNAKERYTDALLRHLFDEFSGKLYDPQSTLLHAAHTAWNALARLEFVIQEVEETQHARNTTALCTSADHSGLPS